MSKNYTFSMIKPHAVENGHTGAILSIIQDAGYKIKALKMVKLTEKQAGAFYAVHCERPFYNDLCMYSSGGPVVAMILENKNAVQSFRDFIGSTNPAEAAEGTIREKFGESLDKNAIHGSDSDENAQIESAFFFSEIERY